MSPDYKSRQDALRRIDADAVILVPGANLQYFTGLTYHLSERPILAVFTADGLSFVVPHLEVPSLTKRPDLEARPFGWRDEEGYMGAFHQLVDALGLRGKRIGVDGLTMRVTELLALQEVDPSLKVIPVERALIGIRAIKNQDEIELMRTATQRSEAALAQLISDVQPGMTERQIARRLDDLLIAHGCDELSFETLVQTGENSDNPHGTTTDRALQANEFLLIDFGGRVNHYPADITRTFCLGTPTDEMQKIYDTVLRANAAAKAAAKPGVEMQAVDKAARDVIEAAGYGEYFTHRTGHGLGMDVHEPIPQIAGGVTDRLKVGMSFTIEPGIYVPGLGGVRIEDNVVVTENGLDVLTTYPRELVIKR